jgi:hypothetical protein
MDPMFAEDNFTYQGEFLDGRFHGQGMLTHRDQRYIGTFVKGKLEGTVQIHTIEGEIRFEGDYSQGKINGHGIQFK